MYKKAVFLGLTFTLGSKVFNLSQVTRLPLETKDPDGVSLDKLAISLNNELEAQPKVSFVKGNKGNDPLVQLRFDIVKDIIEEKLALAKEASDKLAKESIRKRAKEELAKRKDASFGEMTDAELEKLANE